MFGLRVPADRLRHETPRAARDERRVPVTSREPFHLLVREERHFCAVLAHLLMERGGNLANFLDLVNDRLPESERVPTDGLAKAEVYVEFTMLRDQWNAVEPSDRREYLVRLMENVPRLRPVAITLPADTAELNASFVGSRGRRWTSAVAYPGQWSVRALRELAGDDDDLFRDLCRFKWSFNIKPDLAILLTGGQVLCIEAKLESATSRYPSSTEEKDLFDDAFGRGEGRVGQLELQRFMFDEVLRMPCSYALIARREPSELRDDPEHRVAFVTWREAFGACDLSGSIPSIRRLLRENLYL